MASPQREAGYTGIAHEIILAMTRVGFSGREWDVLMVILRETYGVHIKKDRRWLTENELSSRYISWLTGLNDSAVRHVLRALVKDNVISATSEPGRPSTFGLNKDYDSWSRTPRPSAPPESAPNRIKPNSYNNYLKGIRGVPETHQNPGGEHLLRVTGDPGGGSPVTRGEGHVRPGGCDPCDPGGVIPVTRGRGLEASSDAELPLPKKPCIRNHDEEECDDLRFASICPYRKSLEGIRTIFSAKEEEKLYAFQQLEKRFSRPVVLEALRRRVAEAEAFSDRGRRTAWILMNAQDDLIATLPSSEPKRRSKNPIWDNPL